MSNGNLYPEKIAMYFSSMNSLSGKIFADIQAIEGSVKLDNNLSYNEKSKIIDKHLIHDVILRNKEKQEQLRNKNTMTNNVGISGKTGKDNFNNAHDELKQQQGGDEEDMVGANQIFYNDPDLDKDQVTALLQSVYPKKPEKYIYDDNGFYLDEHSEPFSYCTQNQASFCDLEKLVRNLPSSNLPLSSVVRCNNSNRKSDSKSRSTGTGAHHHHRHHHKEKKAPPPIPNSNSNSSRRLSDEILEHNNTTHADGEKTGFVSSGVKVEKMERESEYKNHSNTMKQPSALMGGVPIMGMSFLSSSSKKSQNKKKQEQRQQEDDNEHCMSKKLDEDESNLPNQVQNSDLIAELQAKLKMNKGKSGLQHKPSLTKVSKPKAPPPPPPQIGDKQEKPTSTKKTKPQMTTAGSSSSEKPEAVTVIGLVNNHDVLATNTSTTTTNREKSSEEEFCVDVSSPCRIPTPRTGLDILDNW